MTERDLDFERWYVREAGKPMTRIALARLAWQAASARGVDYEAAAREVARMNCPFYQGVEPTVLAADLERARAIVDAALREAEK